MRSRNHHLLLHELIAKARRRRRRPPIVTVVMVILKIGDSSMENGSFEAELVEEVRERLPNQTKNLYP